MNDEELRAFLDSATVQDSDEATSQNTEAADPESTLAAAAAAEPRRAVPSFDELMNMPSPDAAPAPAPVAPAPEAPAPVVPVVPAQSAPPVSPALLEEPAPAEPVASTEPVSAIAESGTAAAAAPPQVSEWSQAYAQEHEQLVPLILPGFSSARRPARDLPPVFQAEPAAPMEPDTQHVDPAPTQPFDVLSGDQAAPTEATPAAATAGLVTAVTAAAATAPLAAATSTSSSSAPTTPAAAAAPARGSAQPDEDPFAALAPELVDADSAGDEYERIAVTGGVPRGRKALPWLIVGGGALIAIIASIFVINGVRGTDTPAPTEKPAVTAEPAPSETTPPAPKPSEEPAPAPEPSAVPVVDPGSTWSLPIEQWGITVEVSEKLGGSTPYTLFDGNTRVMFDSLPVASGLSDACAAARAENVWGLLKKEDGKLEVIRPEPRCTAPSDAAVYDTIWGVLDYMAKSAKPA